ncbi:hypothetical protein GYMLUDRAFT_941179 [Collybiopsis luxurians FD-317 M1]|uniref:Uncharacterized protein n=1 Tax=Collybiopsis luxurians FD-317 M1 TaxID=944289 RepID=A0A0D0BF45_9AGAR|nr:hypothetical protein GYMLUDRAFT_941179 [Collybiopsis luxurians FD-317 M1]
MCKLVLPFGVSIFRRKSLQYSYTDSWNGPEVIAPLEFTQIFIRNSCLLSALSYFAYILQSRQSSQSLSYVLSTNNRPTGPGGISMLICWYFYSLNELRISTSCRRSLITELLGYFSMLTDLTVTTLALFGFGNHAANSSSQTRHVPLHCIHRMSPCESIN